jgi:predicted RNA-binding protein with PIN domain
VRKFLIDGYNLLHLIREFAESKEESLEFRRERLLQRLSELTAGRTLHLQVVFDGPRTVLIQNRISDIQVVFASPSADRYIRREIDDNARNKNLVIVTSDRKDIGEYARINGIEWMTSQKFWDWLSESSKCRRTGAGEDEEGSAPPGWTQQDDEMLRRAFEGED